ncbi:tautomerase family protein [Bradyrhizobium sp.]|uniref:tautomerase family protein n=1 Tax=Bradyrhizobium sp. TaxID=376 RepID=UPI0025BEDA35|nr:tautomerase family protein [Bradyrhizobium sp.]
MASASCSTLNQNVAFDRTGAKETVMPSTRITTGTWARGSEARIIDAIQQALLSALKIPEYDRDVVLDLYDETCRIVPTGRSDRYTRIEIVLFSGRSLTAKKALYGAVVANLSALGVPATAIKTVLIEVPPDNWGLRGGLPASELDLGFRVDV